MNKTYRVMQVTEDGMRFCACQGSMDKCEAWITENESNFPESYMYLEPLQQFDYTDYPY